MLAFDLETTGLCPLTDRITCAAVCDMEAGFERVFIFADGDDPEEFMKLLDEAPRLCAFNGGSFDLPFIQEQFKAERQRVLRWRLKLHDVLEGCRLALNVTFSLTDLLRLNGVDGKTGNGADAVELARLGRWQELGDYCLNDARRTFQVSNMARIRLPRTHGELMFSREGRFLTAAPPHGSG